MGSVLVGGGVLLVIATVTAIFSPFGNQISLNGNPSSLALTGEARIEYLTGQELLSQPMPSVRASAAPHFQTVTRLEPSFAPGFAELAESLIWTGRSDAAEEAARTALALGSRDPHAYMSLGTSLLVGKWAWEEAEAELRRAVELAGDDPAPYLSLAFLLVNSDRQAEARTHLDHARHLSPVSPDITGDLGALYGWLGDHDAAMELCNRTTQIEPRATWGYACAIEAGRALARDDVVIEASSRLVELAGAHPDTVFPPAADLKSRITDLRRFQLEHPRAAKLSHFRRAKIWIDLEEMDLALDELELAADLREMGFVALLGEPTFVPLREQARFRQLTRRLFAAAPKPAANPLSSQPLRPALHGGSS